MPAQHWIVLHRRFRAEHIRSGLEAMDEECTQKKGHGGGCREAERDGRDKRSTYVSLNTSRDGLMLIPSTNIGDTRRAIASHQEHLKIVEAIEVNDSEAATPPMRPS